MHRGALQALPQVGGQGTPDPGLSPLWFPVIQGCLLPPQLPQSPGPDPPSHRREEPTLEPIGQL